jgi:hypothetical protein
MTVILSTALHKTFELLNRIAFTGSAPKQEFTDVYTSLTDLRFLNKRLCAFQPLCQIPLG